MITSILKFFYPRLKDEEIKKFGLLSATFFMIIGSYWLLRLLKNTIFFKIAFPAELGWLAGQGRLFQPIAKTITPFVVIVCILIYSKLVDLFERHRLFYIICSFYGALFSLVTALLAIRHFWGPEALGKPVLAALGWLSYFGIESFGTLTIALFWSFMISITSSESAKSGFPLVLAGAQLGSIGGSTIEFFAHEFGGIWRLFLIATIGVISVMGLIYYFMRVTPPHLLVGSKTAAEVESKRKKEGFFEGFVSGFTLLVTRPYLLGVLICSTLYEIVAVIIEYQMNSQADVYPAFAGELGFSRFQGMFGICVNTLAFFMALLGTSYLMKRYGLRFCLMFYPVTLGIVLSAFFVFARFGAPTATHLLWSTFVVMIVLKGLSYAVNNPSKDMMYIPTSKSAKFKAKGWVDMFGARSAKFTGAQVTNTLKYNMEALLVYGTMLSLGIIAFWVLVAMYVGTKNKKLLKEGTIIE